MVDGVFTQEVPGKDVLDVTLSILEPHLVVGGMCAGN